MSGGCSVVFSPRCTPSEVAGDGGRVSVNLVILIWGSRSSKEMVFPNCSDSLVNKQCWQNQAPCCRRVNIDGVCHCMQIYSKWIKPVILKTGHQNFQKHRGMPEVIGQEFLNRTLTAQGTVSKNKQDNRIKKLLQNRGNYPRSEQMTPGQGQHLCQLAPR